LSYVDGISASQSAEAVFKRAGVTEYDMYRTTRRNIGCVTVAVAVVVAIAAAALSDVDKLKQWGEWVLFDRKYEEGRRAADASLQLAISQMDIIHQGTANR